MHAGLLTHPEMKVGGESQGGVVQHTLVASDGRDLSTQTSAPAITQPSLEATQGSLSTQYQENPPQQSQSLGQTATTDSSAIPASSSDPLENNPQGLPGGQKRLHVSNLPFRFRDADLMRLFEVRDVIGSLAVSKLLVLFADAR